MPVSGIELWVANSFILPSSLCGLTTTPQHSGYHKNLLFRKPVFDYLKSDLQHLDKHRKAFCVARSINANKETYADTANTRQDFERLTGFGRRNSVVAWWGYGGLVGVAERGRRVKIQGIIKDEGQLDVVLIFFSNALPRRMIYQQSHKPHSDSIAATPKPTFKTMQSARNTTAFRSIFDAGELKSELQNSGVKPSFIPYIWKQVIQNPDAQFDHIPSLPSAAYPLLTSKFKTLTSSVHKVMDSSDKLTTKLLIKLQNGALVEAVIMRYDSRLGKYDGKPRPGGPRSTLCVSSQVGCKMGCTFCATGSMGFKSNLTSGEIVEQLVHASRSSPIRNVVFMGMGEPLNNYGSLVEAIHVMTGSPFHLSPKKITVSTVGIIHAIKKLHSDLPGLNLAVSLHAPVQEIRCQIMPAARAFPLVKLMDTLQEYQKNTQQKIFIEYIMLDGVNDEEQHAHQLGKLLETFQVVINLIPFNPIGILSKFSTSNENKVTSFQKILRGTYGIRTTVRKEMGQDISGACGQLVVNLPNKRSTENTLTDIEDLQVR